ncbi:hypothetical protein D918_00567 [Trichuris suis]|nr:hypothetical protein D918_00567 [Trichuris suis]
MVRGAFDVVPAPLSLLSSDPSHCTWTEKKPISESPHKHHKWPVSRPKILRDVLDYIGDTPMIRMDRIRKEYGLKCELVAKCEFFNSGGSVKDRVAVRMIEIGESEGYLKPGMTIIEPTSGNTVEIKVNFDFAGISVALAAAVKGYKCIIVMPEKMSTEKCRTEEIFSFSCAPEILSISSFAISSQVGSIRASIEARRTDLKAALIKALGAKIIRTPTDARSSSPESHLGTAKRLAQELPDAVMLNQYRNCGNPLAHYDETAEEILYQCDGKLDMMVIGVGTGGTLTGVGRKFKEKCPSVKIVGVDPEGSEIAPSEYSRCANFEVEGIGYDFSPAVLDHSLVDQWVKVSDADTFNMARELILKEGLLCGGSSGSAVWAAVQAAKDLNENQRCVVVLPDGVRNYMTKFLQDNWMIEKGFLGLGDEMSTKTWWWNIPVKDVSRKAYLGVRETEPCRKVVELLQRHEKPVAVVDEYARVMGVVTNNSLIAAFQKGKCVSGESACKDAMIHLKVVPMNAHLGRVAAALQPDGIIGLYNDEEKRTIVEVMDSDDFINFIMKSC